MEVAADVRNSITERRKSPSIEKADLKELDLSIFALENRLKCLRLQKQRKEEKIEVTRRKAQSILEKKCNAESLIASEPETRHSTKSPRQQRKAHQQEMRNIKQAIYLVKLDEARQLKQTKEQHRARMLELEKERHDELRQKHQNIHEQIKQKKKYYEFMGRKLSEAKKQHMNDYFNAVKAKQAKLKMIEDMQKEELRLRNELEQEDKKVSQANREYVAAYNLPRKAAVRYLEGELRNNSSLRESKVVAESAQPSSTRYNEEEDLPEQAKMPRTALKNQLKLRMVLNELKRRSMSTIE